MTLSKVSKQPRSTSTPQRSTRSQPASTQNQAQPANYPRISNSPESLLALQKTIGNRALQRMLASQSVQAKLSVGPANDVYEQEADRVASQVVRSTTTPEQDSVQTQSNDSTVQPKSTGATSTNGSSPASGGLESRVNGSKGSGGALPEGTRSFMESRFGADFSGVRIHTGGEAAQLNQSIQAEAFTHGHDIYFNKNNFNPTSQSGQHLLAHELTHVVQQGSASQVRRKADVSVQNRLPSNRISTKKKKMYLDFVRMKRLDPQFSKIIGSILGIKKLKNKGGDQSGGTYGHWWTEIGDLTGDYPGGTWAPAESYGWWPHEDSNLTTKSTLTGVPGQLNAGETDDPHHGEAVSASQMFHPVMDVDTNADYSAVRNKVIKDIRNKAKSYHGKWAWRLGWGQNCHTFQQWLKKEVGIHNQKGVGWFKRPTNVEGLGEAAAKQKEQEKKESFDKDNPGTDYQLTMDMPCYETFDASGTVEIPAGSTVRALTEQMFGTFDTLSGFNKAEIIWEGKHHFVYKDDLLKAGKKV